MNTFSILRFSPDPEDVEYINVAIRLESGRVVYDPAFPKLRCIAPGYDTSSLKFYLDSLHEDFAHANMDTFCELLKAQSSQFVATKPRVFHAVLSEDAIKDLQHRYLQRRRLPSERHDAEQHVEAQLDALLGGMHIPTDNMLRRAGPAKFLSPDVVREVNPDGFHISRVLSGQSKLVLIDAINLHLRQKDYIDRRARDIAYASYRISEIKGAIEAIEKRTPRRAVVVFGSEYASEDPRLQFALDSAILRSDYVVDAARPDKNFVKDAVEASHQFRWWT